MAAPQTSNAFVEVVRQSGVLEGERLDDYLRQRPDAAALPEAPERLAGDMIRDGILTHFQAERFLQGKWRHFLIGKYKVLDCLGSGGMCSVYLCEHRAMRRRVAIKVLPASQATEPAMLGRFYREARAVAALDHANIVHAYDIDSDDDLHFLVMEYVEGVNLNELIKRLGPLDVGRAAHYIRQAAQGLEHAHRHGLIHRDIKPSNLLLDRQGTVKILDLGLARFFNDETDVLTREHNEVVLGTADYLAPEQALDSHTVDIRADIYSLGLTLYYLLTGTTPFAGTTAQKLIWHQLRQPRPIRELRTDVPEALVAVLMRMIAKEPSQRYQQPGHVAAALAPCVPSTVPPPADQEMPRLSPALQSGGANGATSAPPRIPAPPPGARSPTVPPTTPPSGLLPPAGNAAPATDSLSAIARSYSSDSDPADLINRRRRAAQRGRWLWLNAAAVCVLVSVSCAFVLLVLRQVPPPATTARVREISTPSAAQLALKQLIARIEDPATKQEELRRDLLAFSLAYPGTPEALTSRRLLAQVRSPFDQLSSKDVSEELVREWQPLALVAVLGAKARAGRAIESINELTDGSIVAQGTEEGVLKLWDVVTGKEKAAVPDCRDTSWPWLSLDGKVLASYDSRENRSIALWDPGTGKLRATLAGPTGAVTWPMFSPDNTSLAAGADKTVGVWEANTGRERFVLSDHSDAVTCVYWSPDGRALASGSKDQTIKLWDVAACKVTATLAGHKGAVRSVFYAPDGRTLASAAEDQTVKLWDPATALERATLPAAVQHQVVFSPDGKTAAIGMNDGSARLFNVRTGAVQHCLTGHDGEVYFLRFSADGKLLALATLTGQIVLWQLAGEKKLHEWTLPRDNYCQFASDGRHLILYGQGTAYILRLRAAGPGGSR